MELGHRFLDAFFVTPTDRTRLACRMALNIVRENRERTDIITELLKYLRYRYELTERVLVHHAKLSADAMVGKALELWFDELRDGVAAQITAGQGGAGAVAAQDVAASGPASAHSTGQEQAAPTTGDNNNPATGPDPTASSAGATDESARKDADSAAAPVAGGAAAAAGDSLDDARGDTPVERARKRMQRRILMHGDDGLLEYLRDWTNQRRKTPPATARPERLDALEGLIEGLLRRDLFRLAGRSSTQQASAPTIYADYGRPEQRRALEEDAARFAGIAEPWKVCIWLPPPAPRLKSAEVLVFDGSEIVEFNRSEQYASKRGEDIYDAHARLWAVAVYIHRSVDPLLVRRALVRLAQRMEVRWDREVEAFGRRVLEWPDRLGAREVCDRHNLGRREDELRRLAREQKVARGPEDVETFDALYANYEVLAEALQRQ
jgi:hypothetical protein